MTEDSRIVEDSIPAAWAPGLVELCGVEPHSHGVRRDQAWVQEPCQTPGKRPVGAGFNTKAAERWRTRADARACLEAAQAVLDRGGNLGLVPPPGTAIIDCDTAATAELMLEYCPADTPVMRRTDSSAHFYLKVSPDLPLKAKRIRWETDGVEYALDLRLAGKSQAVVPPSRHASGVDYAWQCPLPESIEDVPHMPAEIEDLLRTFHRETRADARMDNGELPGHDRLRHFVNRWCRIVQEMAEVRPQAVRYAEEVYAGRDERLAQCIAPGGELDRLIESGWERFGGRNPLREDKTDQGFVDLFLASHDRYLYDTTNKQWMEGFGGFWTPISKQAVWKQVADLNMVLFNDAAREAANGERRDRLAAMAKHLRQTTKVTQVLTRIEAMVNVDGSTFDSEPDELFFPADNFAKCVVLNTATLTERWANGARDRFTRQMGAPYDIWTDEAMRYWEDFVRQTFGDAETVSLIQRALGLSLRGRYKPHKLYFLYGRGGTGKSTFLHAIMRAFGSYAMKAEFVTFAGNGNATGSTQTSDIARMKAARLVVCSEIPDRARLGSRLKDLTGGDKITARHMFGHPFEFEPTHSVWVAGNVAPEADFLDPGIERRLMVIPADNVPARSDSRLARNLEDDGVRSAIVAWAVRGLEAAIEMEEATGDPLGTAAVVEEAKAEYWSELNPVDEWFRDHVVRGAGEAPTSDLYKAFLRWIEEARGLRAGQHGVPDMRHFGRALKRLGLGVRRGTGGKRITTGVGRWSGDGKPGGPGNPNNRAVLQS